MIKFNIQSFWQKIKANQTPGTIPVDKQYWNFFSPGEEILEVGCAWGRIIFECYKRKLKVTGIDINKNEIKSLQTKLKEERIPNSLVKVVSGNILSNNFKSNSFQGILLLGILSALPKKDRSKCLKEIYRITKHKGIIYIGEFEMNPDNPLYKERYDKDVKITKEYGTISIKNEFGKELYQSHNFYIKELSDLVIENGFEIIKIIKKTFISYHHNKKPGLIIIARKVN